MQIAVMMGLSSLLFGVSLATGATATGRGVLLAAVARTEAQVGMLAAIVILISSDILYLRIQVSHSWRPGTKETKVSGSTSNTN
jgi:hypothetical protein